ncbi:hypothetical protein SLEP1_g52469 [Rubroshorea leprosula]|uniref:AAA+ ATPase domain-containing protein n=1 Tax=Rubroshorea leprosula TaxID=152421 RepID=A0AAV5M907_9ROSI|nr:hypothetical protein SLEP1_g52469 [Rubroshorea leprosula]
MADTVLIFIPSLIQTIAKAITPIQAVTEGDVCGFKATAIQVDTGLIPPFTLASLAPGLQEKFAALAQLLTEIQAAAEGAEEMQEIDPALKPWLQELKDAVYDAVDLLDECGYRVLEMKNEKPGLKLEPEKVDGKLSEINGSLAEIRKEVDFINLKIKFRKQKLASARRPYHKIVPILESSEVVGREDDVSKMVSQLDELRSKHPISGISIVGVAGVGKTTVARLIYMKAEEEERYDVVAWVCVSEEFNDQRILGELLEYFNISYVRPNTIHGLLQDLGKELEKKTFLLILDDAQEKDAIKWNDFLCNLSEVVKTDGNSIVLTTRSEGVAAMVEKLPMYRYDMQRLSDGECWMIIKKLVLRLPSNPDLHYIAGESGGLPLVATAIGEAMNSIKEDEWLAITRYVDWKLENSNSILSVLKQSFFDCMPLRLKKSILSVLKQSFFDCMPLRLKKCFSYCSIFPIGSEIRKDDLIQLWMAGGFLQQSNESSMTMEDIGNKYLNELVSNSLFPCEKRDACGNVESYKMLYLVHQLALSVSTGETSIWKGETSIWKDETSIWETKSDIIYSNVRNERIHSCRFGVLGPLPQRLHSLFFDDCYLESDLLIVDSDFLIVESDLKSLRSLKFKGCQIQKWPISLDKSRHLRYFEIAESSIHALPESLSKLYMLQTLKVMQCKYLDKLPDDINKLDSLRHLCLDKKSLMPEGIRHLTSLQTLPIFFVRTKKGFTIEELGCLSQLRGKMEIQNLDCVTSKSEAIRARLNEKTELHELVLVWNPCMEFNQHDESQHEEVLEGLQSQHEEVLEGLQPHSNLKSLSIINYHGSSCPSWIDGLSSLQQLKLESCIELISIPEDFRKLHSLSVLDITHCSKLRSIPGEWLASLTCLKELRMGPFSEGLFEFPGLAGIHYLHASLESLTLNGWNELRCLPPQVQHLTALKELVIRDFSDLEVLPEWLGALSSLRELNIISCDRLRLPSVVAMRRLSNLQSLIIEDVELCPEWEKISHILNIRIDGRTVQSQQQFDLFRHSRGYV